MTVTMKLFMYLVNSLAVISLAAGTSDQEVFGLENVKKFIGKTCKQLAKQLGASLDTGNKLFVVDVIEGGSLELPSHCCGESWTRKFWHFSKLKLIEMTKLANQRNKKHSLTLQ